jgi:transposase-like protein
VVQRCQFHKRRNILGHLPERMHASVGACSRKPGRWVTPRWRSGDSSGWPLPSKRIIPGAAALLRVGLEETLTLQRSGIENALYRKLRSMNAIENLNSGIAMYTRNVNRWQGGSMVLRWVSAAILEAERKFRRVQGNCDIPKLMKALEAFEAEDGAAGQCVA